MKRHPHLLPYLALCAVCFFWGTTYLGIRMALESFPPLLLVGVRYLISGAIMVAAALAAGVRLPRGRELLSASFTGVLTLGVGNGSLVFAQQFIPSGVAGLILTISPFWMVGIEALLPRGERLHGPAIAGMLLGLAGAALLFAPGAGGGAVDTALLAGFLLLQVGMVGWSFGSLYQRRHAGSVHPVFAAAVQQLAVGLVFTPLAWLVPERAVDWHFRGVAALCYLVVFGSIVGYSAYAYALDRLPVAIVSIYPYVNAVVAMALGRLVYGEPFGKRETAAMLVIFAGVAVVKKYGPAKRGG